jgi:predicted DNA-binding ribbon-helix-helix protein
MARTVPHFSVMFGNKRTSLSLELPFKQVLSDIARGRGISLAELVRQISAERPTAPHNLSSLCRVFVLRCLQAEIEKLRDPLPAELNPHD